MQHPCPFFWVSVLLLEFIQVFFRVKRGHATGPRRGHRLPIDRIGHVAGREYARDAGGRCITADSTVDLDITVVHFQLSLEDGGVRLVSDGNKDPMQIDVGRTLATGVPNSDASYATLVPQDLVEDVIPVNRHVAALRLLEQLVAQDLLGTERVTTVNHMNL